MSLVSDRSGTALHLTHRMEHDRTRITGTKRPRSGTAATTFMRASAHAREQADEQFHTREAVTGQEELPSRALFGVLMLAGPDTVRRLACVSAAALV